MIASIQHNRQDSEVQAVFATHSTVIVDELNHENIILARRTFDSRRGFHTEFSQLEGNFWDKYNLDEYKHNRFFVTEIVTSSLQNMLLSLKVPLMPK